MLYDVILSTENNIVKETMGKGKCQSMDNTKIVVKVDDFNAKMKRSLDERHV